MRKSPDFGAKALADIADHMIGEMGDHPVARQLQSEVFRLRDGAATINNVRAQRSPYDTPSAHALKVAKMARKLNQELVASINRSHHILAEGEKDLQRRIDAKVDLKPDAFASEIRAAFRGLDSKAKANLIKELVDNNRGPEMAAIVKAPPILTGISEQQRAAYEQMIIGKHASAEVDERKNLQAVFDGVVAAHRAAHGFVQRLTDPNEIAQIERAAAEADAATEAFEQSLQ